MTTIGQFGVSRRSTCRICGSRHLVSYLNLGTQPPSNSFIDPRDVSSEQKFPLEIHLCTDCGLSQLLDIVSSTDIFGDYAYLSSISKALCQHYAEMVNGILARFEPRKGSLVVDIGCNDGITLKAYPSSRFRLLGVEPSSAGAYAREAGIDVVESFFDERLGAEIAATAEPATVVTATNVFAHLDDVRGFALGVRRLLDGNGVFVLEFPYVRDMLEQCLFDTIYHEHLSYYALTPLVRLFDDVGLSAFSVERVAVGASGPALRLFVCRADASRPIDESIDALLAEERKWGVRELGAYQAFAGRVVEVRRRILGLIGDLESQGRRVGAFGAPAKGNTLLNYLGLSSREIVAAAENNPLKIGKLTPGSHIPIVGDEEFLALGLSHALLLSWNYLDSFLKHAEFVRRGGKFIVPLPVPEIRP